MNQLEEHLEIDKKKIKTSVRLQLPIELVSYTLPRNFEAYMQNVMQNFLIECHQEHLQEYLSFCIGELLTNAKKANTKRVYFKEKGLDINDPKDYDEGMKTFKDETLDNINYYLELQKKAGLYVKLALKMQADNIYIEIRNNSKLTTFENDRIQEKLALAQQYGSMEEVVTQVLDQSEGAGLGIIIIILMLQRVGLSKDNYQVFVQDDETVTRIILPCNRKISAGVEMISYEFIYLQDKIPILKSNFDKVNQIVSRSGADTEIDRNALLEYVRKDVSLTLLLLKYTMQKDKDCLNIPKALKLLSDDELRFIFSDSNPTSNLIDSTDNLEALFYHASRVAFFSYNLFKNHPQMCNGHDAETMYTLGLLNTLGFLLLETASAEQIQCIDELSAQYDALSQKIMEMFKFGYANNYVKKIYLKRSGFSDDLALELSTWCEIDNIPEKYFATVETIYLAEMMQYYDEKEIDFYQVNKAILQKNKIQDEKQFSLLIKTLKEAQNAA